jgi:hypothetical protein
MLKWRGANGLAGSLHIKASTVSEVLAMPSLGIG